MNIIETGCRCGEPVNVEIGRFDLARRDGKRPHHPGAGYNNTQFRCQKCHGWLADTCAAAAFDAAPELTVDMEPVAWITPLAYGSQITFYKPPTPNNLDPDEDDWYCKPVYSATQLAALQAENERLKRDAKSCASCTSRQVKNITAERDELLSAIQDIYHNYHDQPFVYTTARDVFIKYAKKAKHEGDQASITALQAQLAENERLRNENEELRVERSNLIISVQDSRRLVEKLTAERDMLFSTLKNVTGMSEVDIQNALNTAMNATKHEGEKHDSPK